MRTSYRHCCKIAPRGYISHPTRESSRRDPHSQSDFHRWDARTKPASHDLSFTDTFDFQGPFELYYNHCRMILKCSRTEFWVCRCICDALFGMCAIFYSREDPTLRYYHCYSSWLLCFGCLADVRYRSHNFTLGLAYISIRILLFLIIGHRLIGLAIDGAPCRAWRLYFRCGTQRWQTYAHWARPHR